MIDETILQDLERFDAEYVAQAAFAPGLDTLADGSYDFEVDFAELGRTKNANDPILRVNLRVNGGMVIEWGSPLTSQEGCNRLGADLRVLGFDADKWRGSRSFSKELGNAIPKLKGIKFRAIKRTEHSKDGKTYHKLMILNRLGTQAANGPASVARTNVTPPTPRHGTPAAQQPAVSVGGDEIAF